MPRWKKRENSHFDGECTLCGWSGEFSLDTAPVRADRGFLCSGCGAALVSQAEATVILDEYAGGQRVCLDELVQQGAFRSLAVHHLGRSGPIVRRLRQVDDFGESGYDPDLALGAPLDGKPPATNQDHCRLTFPDERFDLIVSSHVLEHVPEPSDALSETRRVLRPGGRYIFSIPGAARRATTARRAQMVDGEVVDLLERRYHNSPSGERVIVFHDFGRDIIDLAQSAGLDARIRRPHRSLRDASRNIVVVATRQG